MIDWPEHQLPTLDRLGVTDPGNISALDTARSWFSAFSDAIQSHNATAATDLFLDGGFWKDILALTWDLRTIGGRSGIQNLLNARLAATGITALHLSEDGLRAPELQRPYPDLVLLRLHFTFETKVGRGSGVCTLVPVSVSDSGSARVWKAYTVLTCLDGLQDFPEKVGHLRNQKPDHGTWETKRTKENEFPNNDPTVVVVGAGHVGLEIAARLKYLGIPALIIEKTPRVGDVWRTRYKALCLHDPVWYCETPYLGFPSSWPVYTPAPKLADWLEGYAHFLELNVWTASNISGTAWDDTTKTWTVDVDHGGKEKRKLTAKHLVFATGFGGKPVVPNVTGKEIFKGKVVHSSHYTSAADYVGKKAVVVGACNSGHDICQDFYNHGVDVTMYQRSSTFVINVESAKLLRSDFKEGYPVDLADIYAAAYPNAAVRGFHQRLAPHVANTLDKTIIDGLATTEFKTNLGPGNAGIVPLLYARAGGYYLNIGTSQHIIEGHIKVKNGSAIESYTETGLRFADGTELEADVVVFATGYGDPRDAMYDICPPEAAKKVGPVWGFDKEGQVSGIWRPSGHEGIWFGIGNLAMARFHSLHLAMQIKGLEEGLYKMEELAF
ncbi:FAD/NAD(P)-binding domain-containing protein [Coniophora puteana RWD-64-598 SS2]|uniref:FAD/NAD(P)-binding domain-containing protein n=1 Tax=Coniophora puteana (strain RWD-64-598) TaxID=741705 RepID=A0A5M3MXS9_CONPW|nr:FAD/NAD(P)-binding domain-containing protein [Coniophora puteana RWD-64-598 SS2]EIW83441.1 FAD/NAD(P)-binding domain-containing protein [Coniophora puteana RWD-64-598 SS2]